LPLTRRRFSAALSTTALAAAAGLSLLGLVGSAVAQDVSVADLAKPVPLGDIVLGSENAPVTMIEYASMSCGHCAAFHSDTLPTIKAEYIDTNKVRYIFREFPLDFPAAGASMLARCVGNGDPVKYHAMATTLFAKQQEWAFKDVREQLRRIAEQAGMDERAFSVCLGNQDMVDALQQGANYAGTKLKVDSTPTFFINGTRVKGAYPLEEFRKVIEANLKS
jgi:protein-disulfide isomerase